MIKGYVKAEMHRWAFHYTEESGFITITAGFGARRWKMAISCVENMITCYAAYPRETIFENRAGVLELLNELNAATGFGSYFLLDAEKGGLIVFRCDILIADEYSIVECFAEGIKRLSAAFSARWEVLISHLHEW